MRSVKSEALAAAAPVFSLPAMGCAGTKRSSMEEKCVRAFATTSRLVLPASVTTAFGARTGAIVSITDAICPTGMASNTKSAPRTPSTMLVVDLVDDAEPQRVGEIAAPTADADHAPDRARALERRGKGTTDEADADHCETFDEHGCGYSCAYRGSACPSAARKRSFSSGSPIDTRRNCGMP